MNSNKLQATVSVFDTDTGPDWVCMSFLPVEWHQSIRAIHNIPLKCALNSNFNALRKVMPFSNWYIYMGESTFDVLDNDSVLLLLRTTCIDRLVKEIISKKQRLVPSRFRLLHFLQNKGPCRIRCLYYRVAPTLGLIIMTEIDSMLRVYGIEAKQTKLESPIVFASKKDDLLRFCMYYRKLNVMTVKKAYPFPRMDDFPGSLRQACMFSTIHPNLGISKMRLTTRTRTKRYPHRALHCTDFEECGSVWRSRQA